MLIAGALRGVLSYLVLFFGGDSFGICEYKVI